MILGLILTVTQSRAKPNITNSTGFQSEELPDAPGLFYKERELTRRRPPIRLVDPKVA